MKIFGKLVVAAVLGLSLGGCSVIATVGSNVDQAKLVVQVTTMKVIEAGDDMSARADKVKEIAEAAKQVLDMTPVSVDDLAAVARARLAKLDLNPSDRMLAEVLVDAVAADLKSKVGEGVIPFDQRVRVNTVLSWVSGTANYY